FVQDRLDPLEPLPAMIEEPARAPSLAQLLVGLREEENVGVGHDAGATEMPKGQRLGESEGFHVVGAAAVEVAELDLAFERVRFLPILGERRGDIDVIEE